MLQYGHPYIAQGPECLELSVMVLHLLCPGLRAHIDVPIWIRVREKASELSEHHALHKAKVRKTWKQNDHLTADLAMPFIEFASHSKFAPVDTRPKEPRQICRLQT